MGTEDRFKKAKVIRQRAIKKTKHVSKRVLIACEDTKSSRFYFEKMIKDYGLRGKVTFAKHLGTNPMKVLEAIKMHLALDSDFDEKWIVIDKDSYSKKEFNGTIASAATLGVNVAYSNEAYELWLLLHYKDQTAHIDRYKLQKELKNFIDYEKNDQFIYEIIKSKQNDAIRRSKALVKHFEGINGKVDPYNDNPVNSIYELVESLQNLKISTV
ncbi:RloB family protein [Sulfurovum sp.]|uniref:RloB family protein n=1 Tax=Sulfurovum sp. TaxID=1969726 RepID=UPI00356A9F52